MSAKSEPKTLDNIAEALTAKLIPAGQPFNHAHPAFIAIRAVLTEAYDLGRAESNDAHAFCNEIGVENVANPGPKARLLSLRERISAIDARRIAVELRPTEVDLQVAVAEERKALREIVEVEGMESQAKVRILAALDAREKGEY